MIQYHSSFAWVDYELWGIFSLHKEYPPEKQKLLFVAIKKI